MLDSAVQEAREYFPRGLSQPETGFRFSLDALLLAAFAARFAADEGLALDLGTGCGVVGLSLLLRTSFLHVVGADVHPEMLGHAVCNATRLGLADRFSAVPFNVAAPQGLHAESMDLVLCNPPYRDSGTGRGCPDAGRMLARFESGATLADFIRAAAFTVKNRKSCFFIQLAERTDDLLTLFHAQRLRPKDMIFIHPKADTAARLVLIRVMKNGGAGLIVHPPLVLHDGQNVSAQALQFCPELRCNA